MFSVKNMHVYKLTEGLFFQEIYQKLIIPKKGFGKVARGLARLPGVWQGWQGLIKVSRVWQGCQGFKKVARGLARLPED